MPANGSEAGVGEWGGVEPDAIHHCKCLSVRWNAATIAKNSEYSTVSTGSGGVNILSKSNFNDICSLCLPHLFDRCREFDTKKKKDCKLAIGSLSLSLSLSSPLLSSPLLSSPLLSSPLLPL